MRKLVAFVLMTGLIPAIASAQQETAPAANEGVSDDQVVVTGPRDQSREVRARHVTAIASTVDGQMPRFHDPVCPRIFGLPAAYAERVSTRIREVVNEAGVATAEPGCAANLVVILTPDPDAAMADLQRRIPTIFDGVPPDERRLALRPGAERVWQPVQIRNEDGARIRGGVLDVRSASFINEPTVYAAVGAWMVLDGDAIVGRTLVQLADYIAMRLVAGARVPAAGTGIDTILTLLRTDGGPQTITQGDRAYMQALYATRPNRRSTLQMGDIVREMGKKPKDRRRAPLTRRL